MWADAETAPGWQGWAIEEATDLSLTWQEIVISGEKDCVLPLHKELHEDALPLAAALAPW